MRKEGEASIDFNSWKLTSVVFSTSQTDLGVEVLLQPLLLCAWGKDVYHF